MRQSRFVAVLISAAFLQISQTALADLPPPDDYEETCTAAIQQTDATECVACGADHGTRDKCSNLLASDGFTQACQSHGASVWSEVWCRNKTDKPLSEEAQKEVRFPTEEELQAKPKRGCGCVVGDEGPWELGALLTLALASAAWLRRRK